MIHADSTVRLNMPRIRQLNRAAVVALKETAEELHTEVVQARIVPRKDGTLQNEAFFVDTSHSSEGKVSLVHNTPYARRLYFHPEYNFHKGPWEDEKGRRHEGNPNAKGKWFEDYEPGGSKADFAVEAFKRLYRRLAEL